MTKYVALLRGIGPGNPNMRNDKLRGFFEELGMKNVQSVISSGNILFESNKKPRQIEEKAEVTFPKKLNFSSTTIVRSQRELQALIDAKPFATFKDEPKSRLNVTFLKNPLKPKEATSLPHEPKDKTYRVFLINNHTLGIVVDTTRAKTPEAMRWLEKNFDKQITTRTWKTINRILDRL